MKSEKIQQSKEKPKSVSIFNVVSKVAPMFFKSFPVYLICLTVISIVHGAWWGVTTLSNQLFFDSITKAVQSKLISNVYWMAVLLGAVTIMAQVLNGVHNFMSSQFYKKAEGAIGKKIIDKSALIDPICYENTSFLDNVTKAKEGGTNSLSVIGILLTLFTFYVPYFLFMGIYLFRLSPILAVSILIIFIPTMITQIIRSSIFTKLSDEKAPFVRQYEYYEKCICDREYFKETRILGAVGFFKKIYKDAIKCLNKKIWGAELKTGLIELCMDLLCLTGYLIILFLLVSLLLKGEITVGAFAAVFSSLGLMFGIMDEIVCRHIGHVASNIGSVGNFIKFLELPEREGKEASADISSGIVLSNVTFKYPNAEQNSLENITLEIKNGEIIAVVGENGAGKSTLVKLLSGIFVPTEGTVMISGLNTKEIAQKSLFGNTSAVFQKFQKYKMLLKDNVHISNTNNMNDTYVETSLKNADLDMDNESFPNKLDTMLAKEFDGVDISGGQWQRVAIARGFYREHNIIFLDEPTAAIDPIEETKIYNKFAQISKGKTSIIVTHRLGSAKIANRIIVMDNGKIAEIGSHEELIKNSGKYAQMYKAQSKWYESSV